MAVSHVRVRINGSLPGGEKWSVNPAYMGNFATDQPTDAELKAWSNGIATNLGTDMGTGLSGLLSSQGTIDSVRVERYGADFKMSGYGETVLSTPFKGTQSLVQPATTALALSLYTAVNSRSSRGRLFWPALGIGPDSQTARFGYSQQAANDAAALLHRWETYGPATYAPVLCVWSKAKETPFEVTSIRVGDVFDSIRRRKDSLAEKYATSAFPPVA